MSSGEHARPLAAAPALTTRAHALSQPTARRSLASRWHGLPHWLQVALVALGIVICLRLILGAVLAVTCAGVGCTSPGILEWASTPPPSTGWQGVLLGPWLRNDALWYTQIARFGYLSPAPGVGPLAIFFPLVPMLIRALMTVLGNDALLSGLVLNTLLSVAALTLLHHLIQDQSGSRAAQRGLLLVAVSPAIFFFLAPLSEAAFFTFTVATVLAARRGWIGWAGLLATGATLSRDQGILVLIPLFLVVLERARARHRLGRFPLRWPDASLALAPISFVIFELYLGSRGYPAGTFAAEVAYLHTHAELPWTTLIQSVQLIATQHDGPELLNLLALLLLAFSLPAMWRRLPRADTAYAAASLLVILFHEGGYSPLESAVRFVAATYPVWLLLATVTTPRSLRRLLIPLALSTLVVATMVTSFRMVQ